MHEIENNLQENCKQANAELVNNIDDIEKAKTSKEYNSLEQAYAENNVAILLAANNKYTPYLSVILQSIVAHSSIEYNYDIIIFTTDISTENENKIQEKFKGYNNISIRFFNVMSAMEPYMNLYVLGYYTVETYFRLLAPSILTNYNKILYLDSDMVVQEDVAKLYFTTLSEEYLLAACKDVNWLAVCNSSKTQQKYVKNILKLNNAQNYFQAGVILFNLQAFRETYTTAYIMQFATTENWQLLDQDILNYLAQDRVLFLDAKWNVMYNWPKNRIKIIKKHAAKNDAEAYIQARNNPYIIHYAGLEKPWVYNEVDFGDIWWKYAEQSAYSQELQDALKIALVERKKLKNRLKRLLKKIAMPFVNVFFPHGSKRREKLKAKMYKKA